MKAFGNLSLTMSWRKIGVKVSSFCLSPVLLAHHHNSLAQRKRRRKDFSRSSA
jgi:hypothetical protein